MADLDPDAINVLNDRLNELSDTLGNLSSSVQNQMRAMASSTQTVNVNTGSVNNSTNGFNKLSEASKSASTAMDKAAQNFTSAMQSTGTALASFGKAMVSAEEGFKKYGQGISGLGDAAFSIGKNFGILGGVVGGVIKGVTMFAGEALRMNDTMIQLTRDATKFAGVLPATNRQVADLAANAGYAGEKMLKLVKIAEGVGNNLVALGGTAGSGVVKFAKLADVGNKVYEQFSKLGVSQEDLTKMQANYIRMQGLSGQAYNMQNKTMGQLQKESLGYAENLIKMSSVTGEQADDIQKQRESVKSEMEERIKARQEELLAQKAEREGNFAEAKRIRSEAAARDAILNKMTDAYGPQVASMVGRVLRTGSFDEFSSGLSAMGFTVGDLQGQMKDMAKGVVDVTDVTKRQAMLNEGALKVADKYNTGLDNFALNLGDAAQYAKDLPDAFAATNEAFGKSNIAIGKTTSEREEQAAKELAAKKVAVDKDAEQRAKLETQEREVQGRYQDAMLNLSNVIIPKLTDALTKLNSTIDYVIAEGQRLSQFYEKHKEIINTLGKVVLGTIAAFAGYKVISTVWSVFKGLGSAAKGLWDIFKSAGSWFARLFGGGGAAAETAAVGAEAAGTAAVGAEAAGGLGLAAKLGKGLLGKAALPVAIAMSAYDAYKGFTADENATTGQKFMNAGSSVVNGLTFGLLGSSPEEIAKKTEKHSSQVTESTSKIKQHQEVVQVDTNQRKANIEQNKKLAKDAKDQAREQTRLYKLLVEAIKATTTSLTPFQQSIDDIVTQIGTSIMVLQQTTPAGPGGTSQILSTIKQRESGGNYQAQAKGSSASGAYQFTDSTWQSLTKKYKIGEIFKSAKDAPPEIQDAVAGKYVEDILQEAGGDVSKVPLKWYTGNIQGNMSSSALAANKGMTPQMYQQKWMVDYNRMGATMSSNMGAGDIVSVGRSLQSQGLTVSENPAFGGVTPGVHKGKGHAEGRAIDVNAVPGDDSKNPAAAAKLDALAQQLSSNSSLTVLWRKPGHFDHMHVETKKVSAAMGGIFSGSRGGYPATLHGTELVSPISVDSILMKLAKTPANDPRATDTMNSISSRGNESITRVQNSNNDLMLILTNKLDRMIDAIENSHDTQQKILQYSQM
jgi:hypothetical protein